LWNEKIEENKGVGVCVFVFIKWFEEIDFECVFKLYSWRYEEMELECVFFLSWSNLKVWNWNICFYFCIMIWKDQVGMCLEIKEIEVCLKIGENYLENLCVFGWSASFCCMTKIVKSGGSCLEIKKSLLEICNVECMFLFFTLQKLL
jgi:hypothetical protein